ncbi:phenylalanine--tRNA ligase subunit beta [Sessilibacter corallicola]|uniref:phenylalanine--tRNA ligase subunit beta n=1 Tax=Sessilibacter corallicola TaxID=2904075 RepID=UPI001E581DEB|nr:phenylalanine--tRNA ligase subunit beta [Sessilibacter corallicola]MCE2028992.1 phenylalanine--tRNA ligase subunit beta [Sessilibacter corallicola]
MKFSESWLREWVNPEISTQQLVDQITMAGLEVDAVEPVAGQFTGVVVGEIIAAEQHPDADKLRVCTVAGDGDETKQVVCGAPNARVGIKIPFATVGAVLPPGDDGKAFKIKKAKLRGVESFGMLCAQTELQAGEDDSGLWELPLDAPVGSDLNDYLKLNDQCIEVDLTPNRSDCLCVKGIAREVGVLNRLDVAVPEIPAVQPTIDDTFSVSLEAGDACSRYLGRIVKNVDVSKPSPLWLQEKLRRGGVRSIDAIVDVTNYVLMELGQPMHAFDFDKLNGQIVVRMAENKEKLTLLNDQEVELNDDVMVIADQSGALAMAGIMGGEPSSVTSTTKDIFLEAAFFNPLAIANRARRFGLHTDSSHRFERGVDFDLAKQAMERATQLIIDITGGEPGPVVVAENEHLPKLAEVTLRKRRIESGLGFTLADDEVLEILTRLGLTQLSSDDDSWTFQVPSYRFDIQIEEDLLEEVARIYGYNNLPVTSMTIPAQFKRQTETQLPLSRVRSTLVARGYQEAICYSFVDEKSQSVIDPDIKPVPLQNPISADLSVMRTSLWAGLLGALKHNLNRQQTRAQLFETGLKFVSEDGSLEKLVQTPVIAGVIYGAKNTESWHGKSANFDFYDLKGDVEAMLALAGAESLEESQKIEFRPGKHSALHPGQTAEVLRGGKVIGILGSLHPQAQKALDFDRSVFVFELDQAALTEARVPEFESLSKHPEVRRDLAVVVDQSVTGADLERVVRSSAGEWLTELKIFDVYVGEGIDTQRKSVALGLTFQHPSSNLTDEQINASVDAVVKHLEVELNATLR